MSLTELTGNPRHDQLLMLISERGYMNIDELASLLDVSTQTVRRDIRKLSEQGLITRHHGGAGRASSVVNTAFEQREVSWTEEKKAIAEAVEAAKNAQMSCIAIPPAEAAPLADCFYEAELLFAKGMDEFTAAKAFAWLHQ